MSRCITFGPFELRLDERLLLVGGVPASLGSRAFDVLLALIERRDRVVTKSELLDVVWPGLVVEENNLSVQISAIRRLVGQQAIATVTGRGYRFVMPSVEVQGLLAATPARAQGDGVIVRRLSAIACAEVVDWQDMVAGDTATANAWRATRAELIEPCTAEFGGQTIELTAEKLVFDFTSVVDAVRWAIDLQARLARQRALGGRAALHLRIGIGVEDLIVDDGKLLGDWYPFARDLTRKAAADQTVVTAAVWLFAQGKVPARFRAIGAAPAGTVACGRMRCSRSRRCRRRSTRPNATRRRRSTTGRRWRCCRSASRRPRPTRTSATA